MRIAGIDNVDGIIYNIPILRMVWYGMQKGGVMARGRQVSTYIDEDGENSIKTLVSAAKWNGSESKLLSKLIDFALKNIDGWEKFNSTGESSEKKDDAIYKAMVLISQGLYFSDVESLKRFVEEGKL